MEHLHRPPIPTVNLPREVVDTIKKLSLDGFVGSVQLNFKHGQVLSYHVTHVRQLGRGESKT